MSLKVYSNDLRTNGQALYKTNATMRDIATIMEHPEFNSFFGKYFNDSTDVQAMLMLMKIYQSIPSSDPYEKIAILYQIMSTSKVRAMVMDSFNNWRDGNNGNINKIEDKSECTSGCETEHKSEDKYSRSVDTRQITRHFIGKKQSNIYPIN